MRIKLIEDLPMANRTELSKLTQAIDPLLADLLRIVRARAPLHTGHQVQYLGGNDGKLRAARVVGMKR